SEEEKQDLGVQCVGAGGAERGPEVVADETAAREARLEVSSRAGDLCVCGRRIVCERERETGVDLRADQVGTLLGQRVEHLVPHGGREEENVVRWGLWLCPRRSADLLEERVRL